MSQETLNRNGEAATFSSRNLAEWQPKPAEQTPKPDTNGFVVDLEGKGIALARKIPVHKELIQLDPSDPAVAEINKKPTIDLSVSKESDKANTEVLVFVPRATEEPKTGARRKISDNEVLLHPDHIKAASAPVKDVAEKVEAARIASTVDVTAPAPRAPQTDARQRISSNEVTIDRGHLAAVSAPAMAAINRARKTNPALPRK